MSGRISRIWGYLRNNRKLTIAAGVVLLVVVLLIAARGRNRANSAGAFQTMQIQRGELTATVGATGSVRSSQSATLLWQTTGIVEDVNVKVGDKVRKDEVLAALASTSLPQNVILAQADLVSAQKAYDDLLNSDTDRAQAWIALLAAQDAHKKADDYRQELNGKLDLTKTVWISIGGRLIPQVKFYKGYADADTIADADADLALKQAQLDDAQRAYDRLKGGPNQDDLAAAQAKVDAAQATLNTARILAPFNGTVTQAIPLPGDQVSATDVAFRVDDLSNLLVDVQVSEVDINSIQVGQPVTLTFDAILDKDYHGEVIEVAQAGDVVSGVVNFTATVHLTDADEQVKPGMTAAVNIVTEQIKDQLLIPNRSVRVVDGKKVVYLLVNSAPQKVEVTLGPSSDTMSVILDGDIKEGDLIILNPPAQFQNGPRNGGPFGGGGGG
jgi:HlyD family secretion protein